MIDEDDKGTNQWFLKITETQQDTFDCYGVRGAHVGAFYLLQCNERGADAIGRPYVKFRLVEVKMPIKVAKDGKVSIGGG